MSALWGFICLGCIGLVLVASIARSEPVRLPLRFGSSREGRAMRSIHHGIVVHVGTALACAVAVLAGPALSARGLALYFGSLLLARLVGEWIGRRRSGPARALAPLLAPIDGVAMLVDWMVSPVLRKAISRRPESDHQGEAYDQVAEFMQRTVEQVMTPRSKVVWLRAEASVPEITETSRRRPHARYPVFEGDFERLVGMVDLVDLLGERSEGTTAAELASPAVIVPETIGCDDLLERMRRDRFDTAVVVDEFGGIAGLVSLEDLLEVVVGDLIGEHEAVRVRARRIAEGTYVADATLRIDEFEQLFGLSLPEGDYETLAGLFLSRVVRIPEPGERVNIDGLRLEVVEADSHRIRSLKVTVPGPAQ